MTSCPKYKTEDQLNSPHFGRRPCQIHLVDFILHQETIP
ncbi:hypothetical protein T12_2271 [Trichinella patagoniensis]|uniref:Uncharacterized protein n=1 Tax=Trichinella patagoniensis TaxID=990121 RepID=A0A0V0WZS4_9BILA|nr:hypothetical protein T12_2271 [Trichinella patagoniensis]